MSKTKSDGLFSDISLRIQLIIRLMLDRRVNFFLKLLPLLPLLYLIVPDLIPGPIDDAVIIWLGAFLFIELCPPDVVQEHMNYLTGLGDGQNQKSSIKEEDVVDAEWEEL